MSKVLIIFKSSIFLKSFVLRVIRIKLCVKAVAAIIASGSLIRCFLRVSAVLNLIDLSSSITDLILNVRQVLQSFS